MPVGLESRPGDQVGFECRGVEGGGQLAESQPRLVRVAVGGEEALGKLSWDRQIQIPLEHLVGGFVEQAAESKEPDKMERSEVGPLEQTCKTLVVPEGHRRQDHPRLARPRGRIDEPPDRLVKVGG